MFGKAIGYGGHQLFNIRRDRGCLDGRMLLDLCVPPAGDQDVAYPLNQRYLAWDVLVLLTGILLRLTYGVIRNDLPLDTTARALADGKAVGWFQGRMEFGPRALGNRSILGGSTRSVDAEESQLEGEVPRKLPPFRTLGAARASRRMVRDINSPYMLLVAPVAHCHERSMTADEDTLFGVEKLNVVRSTIPAVTHVDYFGVRPDRTPGNESALS
jgi:carbamoyltransferase